MKLATKLVVSFLSISVITIAIVGYFAYLNGRETIQQNAINHLITINTYKEAMFDSWVYDKRQSLLQLAVYPPIKAYAVTLVSREKDDPGYRAAYTNIIAEHLNPAIEESGFWELFIMRGNDGLILISTDAKQEGKYRENEPYFIQGRKGTYVQNIYYSVTQETLAMTIATPITDGEDNVIAVLAGRVDLAELSEIMMRGTGPSQTEDSYLVNKLNFFITEPRFGQGYALKRTVFTEDVKAGLSGHDGVGFYYDYRGIPVITAYRWMPSAELCLTTKVDQAEAFSQIFTLRGIILAISFTIALFATLAGILVARTVTHPVQNLVKGAEEIGKGNLGYKVATAARDEIGELSRTFDQMTEKLTETLVSRDELMGEIAERKRVESELRKTLVELERSNAELEQFAYVASHDLQEPLRMVSSYTQLLERRYKDKLDGDAHDFINFAVDGAKRMQQLIDDLLTYSRVGTRGKPMKPADSQSVLNATIANLSVAIQESGAVVTYDPLPLVMADEIQLVQLFQNLIGNAIKFHGDKPPRVHVSAKQNGNRWVFSVKDNGIGIDPQYFERIFLIFQRLHREEYPGTGTGLAIAKRIVERHGGQIWIESQPGKGSTFYFTMPMKGEKLS
jgi:signal transduction histidine kinase